MSAVQVRRAGEVAEIVLSRPGEAQRDEHGVGDRAGRRRRRAGAGQAGDRRRARRGAGVLRGPRPGHARRREHARRLLRAAGGGVRRVGAAGPPGHRADPRVLPRRRSAAGVGVRHPDPRRGRGARAARRGRGAAAGDGDLAAAPLRRAGPGDAAVGRRRARSTPGRRSRIGLADHVLPVAGFAEAAAELVAQYLAVPQGAARATKELVRSAFDTDFATAHARSRALVAECLAGPDVAAARAAWAARR